MRPVCICALFVVIASAAPLTVVLDFQGPHSDRSIDAMKREVEAVLKTSFDWRLRSNVAGGRLDWPRAVSRFT